MKVIVNFFKESTGKWYAGGVVNIPMTEHIFPGSQEAIQAIVDYQNILMDGWQDYNNYIVTTRNVDDNDVFFDHLYKPFRFVGIKKKVP